MSSRVLQLRSPTDVDPNQIDGGRFEGQVSAPRFSRTELCGRLTELSGSGATSVLTQGMSLVLDAQREGEPCAWVCVGHELFYPPDVSKTGVDLSALAVIRAMTVEQGGMAAARLARSGAFGLLVLDLARAPALRGRGRGRSSRDAARLWLDRRESGVEVPTPILSRLVGLAQRYELAVVFLTDKPAQRPSLNSLISLRGETSRGESLGHGRFVSSVSISKDKRRGPGWRHRDAFMGPAGLW